MKFVKKRTKNKVEDINFILFLEEDRSTTNWSVPPPASADSGNPGSNLELRESPSLFSDPYRLDLPG